MTNFMSTRSLEFTNEDGQTARATVGFNSLPDWVGQTDYFKLCKRGLTPFVSQIDGTSEKSIDNAVALQEENEALKLKLKALEEKKDLNQEITQGEIEEVVQATEEVKAKKQK